MDKRRRPSREDQLVPAPTVLPPPGGLRGKTEKRQAPPHLWSVSAGPAGDRPASPARPTKFAFSSSPSLAGKLGSSPWKSREANKTTEASEAADPLQAKTEGDEGGRTGEDEGREARDSRALEQEVDLVTQAATGGSSSLFSSPQAASALPGKSSASSTIRTEQERRGGARSGPEGTLFPGDRNPRKETDAREQEGILGREKKEEQKAVEGIPLFFPFSSPRGKPSSSPLGAAEKPALSCLRPQNRDEVPNASQIQHDLRLCLSAYDARRARSRMQSPSKKRATEKGERDDAGRGGSAKRDARAGHRGETNSEEAELGKGRTRGEQREEGDSSRTLQSEGEEKEENAESSGKTTSESREREKEPDAEDEEMLPPSETSLRLPLGSTSPSLQVSNEKQSTKDEKLATPVPGHSGPEKRADDALGLNKNQAGVERRRDVLHGLPSSPDACLRPGLPPALRVCTESQSFAFCRFVSAVESETFATARQLSLVSAPSEGNEKRAVSPNVAEKDQSPSASEFVKSSASFPLSPCGEGSRSAGGERGGDEHECSHKQSTVSVHPRQEAKEDREEDRDRESEVTEGEESKDTRRNGTGKGRQEETDSKGTATEAEKGEKGERGKGEERYGKGEGEDGGDREAAASFGWACCLQKSPLVDPVEETSWRCDENPQRDRGREAEEREERERTSKDGARSSPFSSACAPLHALPVALSQPSPHSSEVTGQPAGALPPSPESLARRYRWRRVYTVGISASKDRWSYGREALRSMPQNKGGIWRQRGRICLRARRREGSRVGARGKGMRQGHLALGKAKSEFFVSASFSEARQASSDPLKGRGTRPTEGSARDRDSSEARQPETTKDLGIHFREEGRESEKSPSSQETESREKMESREETESRKETKTREATETREETEAREETKTREETESRRKMERKKEAAETGGLHGMPVGDSRGTLLASVSALREQEALQGDRETARLVRGAVLPDGPRSALGFQRLAFSSAVLKTIESRDLPASVAGREMPNHPPLETRPVLSLTGLAICEASPLLLAPRASAGRPSSLSVSSAHPPLPSPSSPSLPPLPSPSSPPLPSLPPLWVLSPRLPHASEEAEMAGRTAVAAPAEGGRVSAAMSVDDSDGENATEAAHVEGFVFSPVERGANAPQARRGRGRGEEKGMLKTATGRMESHGENRVSEWRWRGEDEGEEAGERTEKGKAVARWATLSSPPGEKEEESEGCALCLRSHRERCAYRRVRSRRHSRGGCEEEIDELTEEKGESRTEKGRSREQGTDRNARLTETKTERETGERERDSGKSSLSGSGQSHREQCHCQPQPQLEARRQEKKDSERETERERGREKEREKGEKGEREGTPRAMCRKARICRGGREVLGVEVLSSYREHGLDEMCEEEREGLAANHHQLVALLNKRHTEVRGHRSASARFQAELRARKEAPSPSQSFSSLPSFSPCAPVALSPRLPPVFKRLTEFQLPRALRLAEARLLRGQSSDALTDALRCVVEVRRFLEHSLPSRSFRSSLSHRAASLPSSAPPFSRSRKNMCRVSRSSSRHSLRPSPRPSVSPASRKADNECRDSQAKLEPSSRLPPCPASLSAKLHAPCEGSADEASLEGELREAATPQLKPKKLEFATAIRAWTRPGRHESGRSSNNSTESREKETRIEKGKRENTRGEGETEGGNARERRRGRGTNTERRKETAVQSGNSTGQDSASPPDAACRDEAVCPGRGKASCYLCLSSAAAAKPAAPVVRRRQLCTCSGLRLLPRRLQRQPNGVDCDERKREGKGGTEYEREGSEDEVDEGATTQEREGVDRDEGERDKETGKDRKQRGETAWCTCDCESEISAVDSCLSQRGDTKEARKGNREDGPAASQELCTCSQRRETEKTQPRDEERRGPREIVQSEAETAQRTEEAVVLSSAASRDNAESSYLFVGHRSSWRTRATGEKVGEVRESVLALARSRPLRGEREKERKPATRTPAGRSAASDAPPSRKRSAQEVKKITERMWGDTLAYMERRRDRCRLQKEAEARALREALRADASRRSSPSPASRIDLAASAAAPGPTNPSARQLRGLEETEARREAPEGSRGKLTRRLHGEARGALRRRRGERGDRRELDTEAERDRERESERDSERQPRLSSPSASSGCFIPPRKSREVDESCFARGRGPSLRGDSAVLLPSPRRDEAPDSPRHTEKPPPECGDWSSSSAAGGAWRGKRSFCSPFHSPRSANSARGTRRSPHSAESSGGSSRSPSDTSPRYAPSPSRRRRPQPQRAAILPRVPRGRHGGGERAEAEERDARHLRDTERESRHSRVTEMEEVCLEQARQSEVLAMVDPLRWSKRVGEAAPRQREDRVRPKGSNFGSRSAEERQRKETEDELLVPQLGVSPGDRRFQERGIDVHAGELSRERHSSREFDSKPGPLSRSSSTLEPLSARSASSFSFSSSFFSLSSPDILAHDDPLASASASLARSSGSSKPKGPQQQSPSASSSSSSASSSSSSASSPSSSSSSASSSSISRRTLLEAKASRLADFSFLFSGVGDDRLPTFRATRRHSASLKSPSSPSLSPSQSSATSVRVRPPRVALALQRRFLEGQKRAAFSELFGQIEAAEETGCPPSREDGNKRNEGAQREKGAATGQTAAEPTSEGSRRRREGQRNRREREDDHGQDEMRPNGETERELVREGLQPQSESFPRKSASGDALLAGLTDIVQRLKRPGARCGETSSIVFAAETESDRARNDRGKINLRDTEMARRPVEAKSDAQEKDDAGWTLQKTSGCLVGADSAPPPPRETFSTSPFFSSPPSSLSGDDKTGILLTPAFPVPASPPQLPAAHLPRTLTFGETESEVSGASLSSFSDPNGCLKPARHGAEKRKTEVALLRKGLPTRKEEREKALPWSLPRHGEGLSRHPPVVLSSACEQRERLLCPDSACAPRVGETARQPCLQTQPRREGGLPPTEHFIKGEGDGGVWPNAEPAGDSRERFLPRLRFQMDDEMEGSAGDVEAEHEQGADRRVVVGKHEGKNRLRDARESEAFAAPGDGQRDGYAMRAIRTVGEQEKGETEACLQREALPRKCSRDETEGENEHRDSQGRAGRGETPVSGFSSLAPSREVTHVIACAATRPSSRALPSLPETPDVRLITNAISAFSGKRRDSQKEKA
uniref:Eukaryotic translation initiation factor 3 subunit G-2, related n=1 Tax=Neospora caninum (strain Liverpool) TaxID=572307 RepID=A0A0F7U528_NEOCL|nr:TPA: Eukaryotic translation initiation factor 3 subunit G-2, related [Neospora caninum Liverpool]